MIKEPLTEWLFYFRLTCPFLHFAGFPYCIILWNRSSDFYKFFAHRMNEFQHSSVQADAAVWIGTRGAVLQVAFYRCAYFRELSPYLVVSSCLQIYFQQHIIIQGFENIIAQNGFFCSFCLVGVDDGFIVFLVFLEIVGEGLALWNHLFGDHCPVGFFYFSVFYHLGQAGERFGGFSINDQPRGRPIYPVNQTEIDIPRFLVAFFYEIFQQF